MTSTPFLRLIAAVGLILAGTSASYAEGTHDHASLGHVDFPITCSPTTQEGFNHAMALLHHMTYPQAREAFEKLIAAEPNCAMAHWGVAMTLFQPLWPTRPSPAALTRGWQETQKAKSLAPPTERERLFVSAAEAFFVQPESNDYWLRIRRWEDASQKAYAALPNDPEIALFYALSHLATTPAAGSLRKNADESAAIILKVYKQNPDHPGAMHYLVHANDVPGREHELLEITRKYDEIAPNNPHALHMPTHIYTRLGDWDGVIKGNLRAADAALMYPAGEKGDQVWDEFPHAIEYLIYAYLQQGNDAAALTQLKRLQNTQHLEPSFKAAFHLTSTQVRYALERREWNEALQIKPRTPEYLDWDKYMWPEAIAQFAHGLGAAHVGKFEEVPPTVARLTELEGVAKNAGEDLFARSIKVLNLELTGWTAHAQGQRERGVEILKEAAALEAATPKHSVTPGPTLPASELLGDAYLEQKNPTAALAAYEESLKRYPKRYHSLLGATQAARAAGDSKHAQALYKEFLAVTATSTRAPPKTAGR